ncbi:hypothetical protein [Sphingosinicella soli]|uniref:Uncharacterized protein n=1 Tax=Sphingosinicella soli TaxID=333708 RepID=A0A7W7B4H3_9SPHN|nr:hypothetical protein [Sphingosinicella soli]MBB4632925.1 hypothetical protein [Sphingosinicella soli]
MSNVVSLSTSAKAKAAAKKALTKGQSNAKTAKASVREQKTAANIKRAINVKAKQQARLSAPSLWARCRAIAAGDWRAGTLLYRIAYLWETTPNKMTLPGGSREYLALTQADWCSSTGLEPSELKNYAVPRLKKYASHIVQFAPHGRGAGKQTWVHFDETAFRAALDEAGYELKVAVNEGLPLYP